MDTPGLSAVSRPSAMEISDFPGIKLVLLAGNGGAGRTICSATLAFHLADSGRSFG
jgi:hypothetical protein